MQEHRDAQARLAGALQEVTRLQRELTAATEANRSLQATLKEADGALSRGQQQADDVRPWSPVSDKQKPSLTSVACAGVCQYFGLALGGGFGGGASCSQGTKCDSTGEAQRC